MNDNSIACPKCHSTQIHIDKRGFKTGRAVAGGLLTGNIFVAAASGSAGMNNIILTCLKCGHQFKIRDANHIQQKPLIKTNESATYKTIQKKERAVTAMYKCDCGKESCLPIDFPVCPACGRRMDESKTFIPKYDKKSGCLGIMFIPIIVLLLILYIHENI